MYIVFYHQHLTIKKKITECFKNPITKTPFLLFIQSIKTCRFHPKVDIPTAVDYICTAVLS